MSATLPDFMVQMTMNNCVCRAILLGCLMGHSTLLHLPKHCSVSHGLLCVWSPCCAVRDVWFALKSLIDHASNHRTSTSTGGETDCISEKGLSLCHVVCLLSGSVLEACLTHMGTQTYLLIHRNLTCKLTTGTC